MFCVVTNPFPGCPLAAAAAAACYRGGLHGKYELLILFGSVCNNAECLLKSLYPFASLTHVTTTEQLNGFSYISILVSFKKHCRNIA
jgi:hypothetical protein